MHVVDWDSYIVCRRDLVQYLDWSLSILMLILLPELPWLVISREQALAAKQRFILKVERILTTEP